MTEGRSAGSPGLALTENDIKRRKAFIGLEAADIERIRSVRNLVERNVDDYVATFFRSLETLEEVAPLFANPAILADIKTRKREHLMAVVAGEYGISYAEQCIALGMLYSKVGLDVRVFLGAFHQLMKAIGVDITAQFGRDPSGAFERFVSLKKIAFFDIGIIVDVLIAERERTIETQRHEVVERTAALRESEHRFRDIAEVAADWIWETDRDHRFTFFAGDSLRNLEEFGTTPQNTIGKARWELAGGDPERDDYWRQHKEELDAHRPFRQFRYAMRTPAGVRRYMSISGKPIVGPKGEFLGYRGTATDETTVVEALQKAERAEALLRDAVESMAEGFVIFDRDDRFVLCNEIYRRSYTYGVDALVPGARFEDIARAIVKMGQIPAARGREEEWVAERMRLHRDLMGSIEQQLPDGRWLLITERRMADGGTAGLRVDISALKSAQEALSESEQMARGMIETALDAFIQMDGAGNIVEWNPQAEATFGWSRQEVIGKPLADMIMPATYRTLHTEGIARFLATGKGAILGKRLELEALRRDGREIKVELAVTALRRHGGYVFNGFLRDITERRAAETRLQALQMELLHISRLSAMGQMGSALAHEINQPLAAITNYLKAGRRMLETNDRVPEDRIREIFDKAVEQATRASEIIRHLRDFVAKGETERRPEALGDVIEEATTLAMIGARHQNVRLRLQLDPRARIAVVNRIQIQQVLVNLVRNAVEAMAGTERRELAVSTTRRDDGAVEVEIADTGPGLAPEVAAQLFKPFVTTKPHGMGVGLSICQSIIEAHRGRIWADANPTGGASFRFTVPGGPDEA